MKSFFVSEKEGGGGAKTNLHRLEKKTECKV